MDSSQQYALKLAIFISGVLWFIAAMIYFDDMGTSLPDGFLAFIVFGVPLLLMVVTMIGCFVYAFMK